MYYTTNTDTRGISTAAAATAPNTLETTAVTTPHARNTLTWRNSWHTSVRSLGSYAFSIYNPPSAGTCSSLPQ